MSRSTAIPISGQHFSPMHPALGSRSALRFDYSYQMNWKRYWVSAAAVLVFAKGLVAVLFFGVIFDSVYDQQLPCARAEGSEVHAAGLICIFLVDGFTYIYAKGHEKGWRRKDRLLVGSLLVPCDRIYGYYAMPFNWIRRGISVCRITTAGRGGYDNKSNLEQGESSGVTMRAVGGQPLACTWG